MAIVIPELPILSTYVSIELYYNNGSFGTNQSLLFMSCHDILL